MGVLDPEPNAAVELTAEFYRAACALHPGEAVWSRLDAALTNWRNGVQAGVAQAVQGVLHVGASRRIDSLAFAQRWPGNAKVAFVEGDSAGLSTLEPVLDTLRRQGRAVTGHAAAILRGGTVARLVRKPGEPHRAVWRQPPFEPSAASDWPAVAACTLDELVASAPPEVLVLDDSGLAGEALLSLSEVRARPRLIIAASAEQSWPEAPWARAVAHLAGLGYSLFDPSGAVMTDARGRAQALSWYVAFAAADDPLVTQAIRAAAKRFKDELLGRGDRHVVEPAPYLARVETVSLETAARAHQAPYAAAAAEPQVFDIYSRKLIDRPRPVEAALFESADVVPGGMWKVCLDRRHYIEEIGYTDREKLYGVECFPDWEGRRTVRVDAAVMACADTPENAILFGGDPAYYHWILNWLPRLRAVPLINALVRPQERLHLIVSERIPERLFTFFDLLLDQPYDVTRIPEHGVWRFRKLVVPNFFTSNEQHPGLADWYRSRLSILPGRGGRRFYLSRKDARADSTPRRKVVNESEVLDALRPLGFEPLLLEGADVRAQIDLFKQADFVVGPHGAAFANMQFTPAGAKALVLENEWAHTFMADMLHVAGHGARVLVCRDNVDAGYEAAFMRDGNVDSEIRRSRDMVVDVNALVSAVRALDRE